MPNQGTGGPPSTWELLDDQLVNFCRVWDLRLRRFRHPKRNSEGEFYYLDSSDWVLVVARTVAGDLVLVRQFRFGSNSLSWELPGGIIDAGEDPIKAGLRELREETGYRAKNGRLIGSCRPNPAIMNNHCHFVFADEVEFDKAGPEWDEHEEMETLTISESEALEWARICKIEHALALTGLFYYQLFIGNT